MQCEEPSHGRGPCQPLAAPAVVFTLLAKLRREIDYAFQPIVNIHTGTVYGFEALLRGQDKLGFAAISDLFDHAQEEGVLVHVEGVLRELAFAKFARLPHASRVRLFFNLDPRILRSDAEQPGRISQTLRHFGLDPASLVLELSELHDVTAHPAARAAIGAYRQHKHQLAIDDFGTGFAGLKLLYEHPPELIKIDRFFISDIAADHKKSLFVAQAVELAHVMGISVVAEGVETEREFLKCKEIGCDLVQGYLVARPTTDLGALRECYEDVERLNRSGRRLRRTDSALVRDRMTYVPPLFADTPIRELFEMFRQHKAHNLFPVLDRNEQPLGLVQEIDMKEYTYSTFGRDLLLNHAYRKQLPDFVSPCPVADINSSAERILEAYTTHENPAGVIIVEDFRYAGFLSANALLRLIDEKNLALARDQNPLTRLPGNNTIVEYVGTALARTEVAWTLVYFDFDHFKPFNDTYGFRQGDRAIALFGELMQKRFLAATRFCGHVGGDDFFAGFPGEELDEVVLEVRGLMEKFARDVESFYDPETRARQGLVAVDRDGTPREYPLLGCSAAVLHMPVGARAHTADSLFRVLAEAKKCAKADPAGLHVRWLAGDAAAVRAAGSPFAAALAGG